MAWKKTFSHIRFDKIYTSSLSRCRDTADLIDPESDFCIDPGQLFKIKMEYDHLFLLENWTQNR